MSMMRLKTRKNSKELEALTTELVEQGSLFYVNILGTDDETLQVPVGVVVFGKPHEVNAICSIGFLSPFPESQQHEHLIEVSHWQQPLRKDGTPYPNGLIIHDVSGTVLHLWEIEDEEGAPERHVAWQDHLKANPTERERLIKDLGRVFNLEPLN
jgi:hypothetical protein